MEWWNEYKGLGPSGVMALQGSGHRRRFAHFKIQMGWEKGKAWEYMWNGLDER